MKIAKPIRECCAPIMETSLDPFEADRLAALFKALADPGRLRLLSLIASHPLGGVCACDLVTPLGLAQPTVSHHLKVLHAAGLLERERRGVWIYYRAVPKRLHVLRDALGTPGPLVHSSHQGPGR